MHTSTLSVAELTCLSHLLTLLFLLMPIVSSPQPWTRASVCLFVTLSPRLILSLSLFRQSHADHHAWDTASKQGSCVDC
ncbi:hypothetical protein F5Y17DRAFT_47873 [Xylariaceae sp. FL0594]|nr:hypothetical protein F5Y17DRAFT_47873 [Xylariaceae sp. FL0594]